MEMKLIALVYLIALFSTVQCQDHEHDDHFCLNNDEVFKGHRHYTTDGDTCLFWKDVWTRGSAGFPDVTVEAAENNCRDPDGRGYPWCYVSKQPLRAGQCDIPKCNDRDSVLMSVAECKTPRIRAGYKNGDVIPIYSDQYPSTTRSVSYPGCAFRFEACKTCKFHIKVDADLPQCTKSAPGKQCAEGCQTVAIRDGLYNETIAEVYSGSVVGVENFHTVSNVLIVQYCQLVNTFSQTSAKYKVTAFVTTKHIHKTAAQGEIQSPNFPHGYYSEKETYIYSVDPPASQLDSNVTLIFYDWDLNGSAGSTVLIKWNEKLQDGSVSQQNRSFSASDYRPALFIPAPSFRLVFDTGRIRMSVTDAEEQVGFTARWSHVNQPSWPSMPDTRCGRYLSRAESIGGVLTYHRLNVPDINSHVDCIWVILVPRGFTNLRYQVHQFSADPTVSLVIKDGLTSQGNVLPNTQYTVAGSGLFVHVSGKTTSRNIQMNITYLATAKAYGGQCRVVERRLVFYCRLLDVCIDQELYGTHAGPVCGINTKPKPVKCPEFTCDDGSGCYTQVTKCNMYKDCHDGSDEGLDECYGEPAKPAPSVNIPLAVSLPIVGLLFLVPIIIVIVYIVRQRRDELKDEEIQASKKQLVTAGYGRQGMDNPGLQLDDIPLSLVDRSSRPISVASSGAPSQHQPELIAPIRHPNPKLEEIRADIHQGRSPYSPRGPGETQSMRIDQSEPRDIKPTRSHRFDLPPDIDRIEELPEEPKNRYAVPKRYQPRDQPRDHVTLANYRPNERPYGEPEGRSYRDPHSYREPSYQTRQPGDGSVLPTSPKIQQDQPISKPINGARPKNSHQTYSQEPRFNKNPLSQYRPDRDLPPRYQQNRQDHRPPHTTQSYRVEPDRHEAPPREARSYRFQNEDLSAGGSTQV